MTDMFAFDGKFSVPELPGIGNEIADETFKHSEIVTIEGRYTVTVNSCIGRSCL